MSCARPILVVYVHEFLLIEHRARYLPLAGLLWDACEDLQGSVQLSEDVREWIQRNSLVAIPYLKGKTH